MRSKLTCPADYREISIPPELLRCEAEEADIRREEAEVLKRHMITAPAERIAEGSLATLRLTSRLPRFNRARVTVVVGQGLFSPAVEACLPGKRVGDSFSLEVDGEPVHGEVLSIQEKRIPAGIDDIVFDKALDGADNYEDWLTAIHEKIKADLQLQAYYRVEALLLEELRRRAQPQIDAGELEEFVAQEYRIGLAYTARAERKEADQLSEEKRAKIRSEVEQTAEKTLLMALCGQSLCQAEGCPCPEGKDEIQFYSVHFRRALALYVSALLGIENKEK